MSVRDVKLLIWDTQRNCHYCERVLDPTIRTVDHIWPRSRGGTKASWNLVACCRDCNRLAASRVNKCNCDRCGVARDRLAPH